MFCLSFHAPFIYSVFHLYASKFPLHLCHFRTFSLPYQYFLIFFKYKAQRKHSKFEKLHSHTPFPPNQSQSALRLSFVLSDRSLNLPSMLDESARSSVSSLHQPNIPSPDPEHRFAIRFPCLSSRGGTSLGIQVNCVSASMNISSHRSVLEMQCRNYIMDYTPTKFWFYAFGIKSSSQSFSLVSSFDVHRQIIFY